MKNDKLLLEIKNESHRRKEWNLSGARYLYLDGRGLYSRWIICLVLLNIY